MKVRYYYLNRSSIGEQSSNWDMYPGCTVFLGRMLGDMIIMELFFQILILHRFFSL